MRYEGYFRSHLGTAPDCPSFAIWAQNAQISGSVVSLLSLFDLLFFSPEMKRNEMIMPLKHPFSSLLFLSRCFITRCQLPNTLKSCLTSTKCSRGLVVQCCFLLLGYSGGCVVMRGRSHPGRWEVRDCRHFKAMSLCKQPVENREKTKQEEGWPFHPCYLDWESEPGLASCFKVMWKLHGHSQWNQHYFNFVRVSWIPLFQNSAWQTADN